MLALADAPAGTEALVRVAPEYAYLDPSHGPRMVPRDPGIAGSIPARARRRFPRPPAGVDPEAFLFFDARVVDRRVAAPVRRPASQNFSRAVAEGRTTSFPVPFATKRVLREGDGWERPRPPFDVAASVEVRAAEKDEARRTAERGATVETADTPTAVLVPETVVRYVSGDGTLPPELDAAIATMRVGEEATVYAPPKRRPDRASLKKKPRLAMTPDALELAARRGVEYRVRLLGMTHVRDVFGDGAVVKRRLEEGVGDFPGDCPVRDCAVRARRRRAAAAASLDDYQYLLEGDDPFAALASANPGFAHDTGAQTPLAFRLGAGAVPAAVETSVRLMLPGETALVIARDARGAARGTGTRKRAGRARGGAGSREARGARARARRDARETPKKRARLGFRRAPFGV